MEASIIEHDILARIASAQAEIAFTIGDTPATYIGTRIPFHGNARFTATRESISAEMDDLEDWHTQMLVSSAGVIQNGDLFRSSSPGRLIDTQIVPQRVVYEPRLGEVGVQPVITADSLVA